MLILRWFMISNTLFFTGYWSLEDSTLPLWSLVLFYYRILIFRRFYTPVMISNTLLSQDIDFQKILHFRLISNTLLFTEYWSSEDSTLPSWSLILFFLQDIDLQKILHSRQLGLKLIANVTYGYTSASFSGRMPCVEVADSVVAKVYSNAHQIQVNFT